QMLGSREGMGSAPMDDGGARAAPAAKPAPAKKPAGNFDDMDDDIPF
ncbi:MAG: single-stranded DNA-binding protein, partial [Burkholderiales bacterium]|nr:single-stranded DNA-binding protein [Burkholderiales bacterium]